LALARNSRKPSISVYALQQEIAYPRRDNLQGAALVYIDFWDEAAICVTLIWMLLRIIFPDDMHLNLSWLVIFIVTFSAFFYYDFSKAFERALKGVKSKK
jgi:hypothetical protein